MVFLANPGVIEIPDLVVQIEAGEQGAIADGQITRHASSSPLSDSSIIDKHCGGMFFRRLVF
jgi:hypothetical protein